MITNYNMVSVKLIELCHLYTQLALVTVILFDSQAAQYSLRYNRVLARDDLVKRQVDNIYPICDIERVSLLDICSFQCSCHSNSLV